MRKEISSIGNDTCLLPNNKIIKENVGHLHEVWSIARGNDTLVFKSNWFDSSCVVNTWTLLRFTLTTFLYFSIRLFIRNILLKTKHFVWIFVNRGHESDSSHRLRQSTFLVLYRYRQCCIPNRFGLDKFQELLIVGGNLIFGINKLVHLKAYIKSVKPKLEKYNQITPPTLLIEIREEYKCLPSK